MPVLLRYEEIWAVVQYGFGCLSAELLATDAFFNC